MRATDAEAILKGRAVGPFDGELAFDEIIDAYRAFDQREEGWVEVAPAAS